VDPVDLVDPLDLALLLLVDHLAEEGFWLLFLQGRVR